MRITHTRPTDEAYGELQAAYDHFNRTLFDGRLPPCVITLQRKGRHTFGYYAPSRFGKISGEIADEIAMNPMHFRHQPLVEVLSTLVHEMVHLWQEHFGRPSRSCYHNREWGGAMLLVGLHPSNTGKPGGRMTGQQMTHYIKSGGRFERAANELLATGFRISWFDRVAAPPPPATSDTVLLTRTSSGTRITFVCPECAARAWGKASLNLICGDCERVMQP